MKEKRCLCCKIEFRPKRNGRYCSKKCFMKSPERKAWERKHNRSIGRINEWRRRNDSFDYKEQQRLWRKSQRGQIVLRRSESIRNLNRAIKTLTPTDEYKKVSIADLYRALIYRISKNPRGAKKLIKGGIPDAAGASVEFKAGFDVLRPSQLIYDILKGRKGKVRWLPSWDSLELTLEKKRKDESILFDSYLSYLLWCENPNKKNI